MEVINNTFQVQKTFEGTNVKQMETPTVLYRRAGDKEDSPASIEILVKSWGVALFLLIIFILRRKTILWFEVRIVILSLPHHPF